MSKLIGIEWQDINIWPDASTPTLEMTYLSDGDGFVVWIQTTPVIIVGEIAEAMLHDAYADKISEAKLSSYLIANPVCVTHDTETLVALREVVRRGKFFFDDVPPNAFNDDYYGHQRAAVYRERARRDHEAQVQGYEDYQHYLDRDMGDDDPE
ncbi:MAG: hypothetical protein K8U57_06740 [Planctomycetes bacterium]|nr:hypothetical protein [Planctomycetota bacterium]